MNSNDRFRQVLKHKGTGKTMSKHMNNDDLMFVAQHWLSEEIPLARKATLLTAWLMLPTTPEEGVELNNLKKNYKTILPKELHYFFKSPMNQIEEACTQLLNQKPLSRVQLNAFLNSIYTDNIPDYYLATLFEGLRLKEETFEENTTVYDFFAERTLRKSINIPLLVDLATPYDGFNRSYFLQPFLAALLGSVGIPTLLHGVKDISPKNGMNTHKLFLNAQKNPLQSIDDVCNQLTDPTIGWGYLDQSVFCPDLHQLIRTRIDMVKRPVLATIEKWLRPINGKYNVCVTGFTHPPYKQKTIDLVSHAEKYNQLLLVRGVEGSTLLPFDRRAPFITMQQDNEPVYDFMSPEIIGVESQEFIDQDPNNSLDIGIKALTGKLVNYSDYLKYQALAIGTVLNKDLDQLGTALTESIQSGNAFQHWERGSNH